MKRIALSLLVPAVLLILMETGFRAAENSGALHDPFALPGESGGLYEPDETLMWVMKANMSTRFQGVRLKTNDLGLRDRPILPKATNEFRILSLGESTTFGAGVEPEETYSFLLEEKLREAVGAHPVRVINAGMSAYSSYQSLVFLKTKGIELKPDLVLFYHEVNDYLPSSLRTADNVRSGLGRSDREVMSMKRRDFAAGLVRRSALCRFIANRITAHRIGGASALPAHLVVPEIGLGDGEPTGGGNVVRRLSTAERAETLGELADFCEEKGIDLVVIHPAYRDTVRHECALTRFCSDRKVSMLEAWDSLRGGTPPAAFLDAFHPSGEGHRRLAGAIADYLISEGLVKQ
ncbi:MAG: hypothetical protein KJ626_08265 [Verrucomicrobia bacterium]|nr:hypothetical protein [Verrucomicrobiota bacterium]